MTTPDLSKPYDPREVESRWYERWEKSGVFEASDAVSERLSLADLKSLLKPA